MVQYTYGIRQNIFSISISKNCSGRICNPIHNLDLRIRIRKKYLWIQNTAFWLHHNTVQSPNSHNNLICQVLYVKYKIFKI